MTLYRVYDIENQKNKRPELTNEQIDNIEVLIENKTNSIESVSVLYTPMDQNIGMIYDFNENYFKDDLDEASLENDLDKIAEKLVEAEKVIGKNGEVRRNRNITEGILFIKYTSEELILLKLESTEIIDRESFKSKQELSTDKDYYKIAIIEKDNLQNVTIVDRNKTIAKYWAESFLELTRVRDSYTNTQDLMSLLKKESILDSEVWADEVSYHAAKRKLNEILYVSYNFNKSDIFQSLSQDENIKFKSNEITEDNIFNIKANQKLDVEFTIDREVVYQHKNEKLKITDEIIIDVKNFEGQYKLGLIKLDEHEETITVEIDADKMEEIRKKFSKF